MILNVQGSGESGMPVEGNSLPTAGGMVDVLNETPTGVSPFGTLGVWIKSNLLIVGGVVAGILLLGSKRR